MSIDSVALRAMRKEEESDLGAGLSKFLMKVDLKWPGVANVYELAVVGVFIWLVEAVRHNQPYASILTNDQIYTPGESLKYIPGHAGNLEPSSVEKYRIARAPFYIDRLGKFRATDEAVALFIDLQLAGIDDFVEGLLGKFMMPISYFLLLSDKPLVTELAIDTVAQNHTFEEVIVSLSRLSGTMIYFHEIPNFWVLTLNNKLKQLLRRWDD